MGDAADAFRAELRVLALELHSTVRQQRCRARKGED